MLSIVELLIDVSLTVNRSAPCLATILAVEMGDTLVVVTLSVRERHITRAAYYKHAVALAVGNDCRVTESHVHVIVRRVDTCSTLTLDNIEDVAPCLAIVLAYTCTQVNTAVCCHTDVGAAVTVVGNGNDVTVFCCSNGRDAVRNSRRCRCREHVECRLRSADVKLHMNNEVRECDTLVCAGLCERHSARRLSDLNIKVLCCSR